MCRHGAKQLLAAATTNQQLCYFLGKKVYTNQLLDDWLLASDSTPHGLGKKVELSVYYDTEKHRHSLMHQRAYRRYPLASLTCCERKTLLKLRLAIMGPLISLLSVLDS